MPQWRQKAQISSAIAWMLPDRLDQQDENSPRFEDGPGSVHPRLRFDVLDVVGHRVGVDRAVVDLYAALGVDPGEGVLHPLRVVAVGEVLAGVGAAAFLAVGGGVHRGGGLDDKVLEFERLDR